MPFCKTTLKFETFLHFTGFDKEKEMHFYFNEYIKFGILPPYVATNNNYYIVYQGRVILLDPLCNNNVTKPVINFTNILHTNFFVQTLFWQLFCSYMYVEKAAETTFVQKICK